MQLLRHFALQLWELEGFRRCWSMERLQDRLSPAQSSSACKISSGTSTAEQVAKHTASNTEIIAKTSRLPSMKAL